MSLQAYNSATDTLTPIAENDYKDSLEKVSALPTASADLIRKCYLLTATQGAYVKGGIYQCQQDGQNYVWVLINGSGVPVDVVEDANMNAVTSNAVFDTTDALDTRVTAIENGLGTASAKDATDTVRQGSHDLVESNAVANAINQALSSIYVPRGSLSCAELTSALLIEANVGNVYEMSDSGTTSALFIQGAGTTISVGDNVGIIKAGESTYMYNYMGNAFDLTDYQKKDLTQAVEGQTTVEGALGALSTNKATQAEVNDIVNVLGAKNLLPNNAVSQTINGVTFTVNADGSVTVNGTATANAELDIATNIPLSGDYILSDAIAGESGHYWAFANVDSGARQYILTNAEMPITVATKLDYFRIKVFSGETVSNVTFKPMIRLASDPDSTYVPYSRTNQELTGEVVPMLNILGAKNVLPNKLVPKTTSGVVYSVNSDGTINMHGTNTSGSWVSNNFCDFDTLKNVLSQFKGKRMIFSITSNYDFDTNNICLYYNIGGTSTYITPNPREAEFVVPNNIDTATSITVPIGINGNKTANTYNLGIMLRPASIQDSTYVPYAKTNRELMEDVIALQDGAGLPKKTLIRTLANGKITATIPKNLGSSYAQGSLKLIGSNADSEAHVTFCLNADNTAVTISKLTNLGSKELTLDSANISGDNLVLEISGVQNYAWASAEYFMSLSAGANAVQPTWTFIGS